MARLSKSVRLLLAALAVLLVLIVGVAIFIVSLLGEEMGEVELRLRLEPGKSYAFRIESAGQSSEKTAGTRQDSAESMAVDYTFDVEQVDAEGSAAINVTCDGIRLKRTGTGGEIAYDSRAGSTQVPEQLKHTAARFDQSFWIRLSPKGRVLEVRGLQSLLGALVDDPDLPPEIRTQIARQQEQIGGQLMALTLESFLAIYADGPVRPGDSWQRRFSEPALDAAVASGTFTLKRRKRGVAVIAFHSEADLDSLKPGRQIGTTIDVSASGRGTFEVDEATGCIRQGEIRQKLSATVEEPDKHTAVSGKGVIKVALVEKE